MSRDAILTINAGSSSLKFAVFDQELSVIAEGKIQGIGRAPEFTLKSGATDVPLPHFDVSATHEDIAERLLGWLVEAFSNLAIKGVGHRIVHGGREFTEATRLTPDVIAKLAVLTPLAPSHQPHNLAAVALISDKFPHITQVGCFDTAFHTTQDPLAKLFAIPHALSDEGVLRYGFHGLSYQYIASVLPDHLGTEADGRVIVAHLGNGASLCAMKNRQSVATSMGFTALDGLMMGRRSGAIDPGVILHLMQAKGMSAAEVEKMLYRESGLLGVSGISNAMQILEQSEDPRAAEAIELYCYRAAEQICALLPKIGGLDALVFTAGIGENSALIRQKICARLDFLGLELSQTPGPVHQSAEGSDVKVLVIPTDEECVLATETCDRL